MAVDQDKGDGTISFSIFNVSTQTREKMSMPGSATIKELKEMLLTTGFTRIPLEVQEIRRRWPPDTLKDGQTLLECVAITRIPLEVQESRRRWPPATLRDGQTLLDGMVMDSELILEVKDFDASLQRRRRHRSRADTVFEKPAPCVLM